MSRWADEISTLDAATDYERIYFLLSACEFSWDIEKALEFALFRTYAVPSISGLLSWTGEFRTRTRKRYDDTELLLSEISENGQESDRGQAAIKRMNEMHGRYRISNNDMLYVLSTFVVEPVHWLARFGKRAMTPLEMDASVQYYRALGRKMGISDLPPDFTGFEGFHRNYEAEHFCFAPSNAEIGGLTRDLLLSMYVPGKLVPFCRPAVHALCDPPLRKAMGFDAPPLWLEKALVTSLKLRARLLRYWPVRRQPRLITRRGRPTYPAGYQISELGTFVKQAEAQPAAAGSPGAPGGGAPSGGRPPGGGPPAGGPPA